VKKKFLLIVPFFILTIFSNLINFGHCFFCNLYYINSNKQKYYINENIQINASWELDYNQYNEIAYIQIQIFDCFNNIVWNSSEYDEIGYFKRSWNIKIINLNVSFINGSNTFFIKFFSYYYQISTMDMAITYLETIEIEIMKRTLMCELIRFKNHVKIGDNLSIIARFYDKFLEDNSLLINQSILFNIISNESLIFQSNYITNDSGIIIFDLFPDEHLELGKNILVFIVKNNIIYNDSVFFYEILLEKNLVYVEIIGFKEIVQLIGVTGGQRSDHKQNVVFYLVFVKKCGCLHDSCIGPFSSGIDPKFIMGVTRTVQRKPDEEIIVV